jgi:hypothetical protein
MWGIDSVDGGSEIDRADGFVETAISDGEVLSAHREAPARKTFTQIAEGRLRGASGLIAKLRVADFRLVDGASECAGGDVDFKALERETIIVAHGRTPCSMKQYRHGPLESCVSASGAGFG